jgi:glycosyltransferase involved in cell wall biosynthesis
MTDDPSAKTTVVMPIWDEYVTDWLGRAVADLSAQQPRPQIIVVDNASEVAVPALAGVTVVRSSQRLTRGAARNLGLAHVATPYVVMWDADDTMPSGTVAFLEHAIASDPRLVAYAMGIIEHPSGARHRWPRRWIGTLVRAPRLCAFLHCVWSVYPTTGSTIMRTDLVRAAGGYGDTDTGEDWLLGVSLVYRGRLGWSERPGRVYRRHERSNWARNETNVRYQLSHARAVRDRVRADRGTPAWARRLVPMIQICQYAAIGGHTTLAAARRLTKSRCLAGS